MNRKRGTILTCFFVFTGLLYFLRNTRFWFFSDFAGANDWDAQLFYLESLVRSVKDYGEIPLWNPWYVGGLPVLENPQTKFGGISMLAGLLLGSVQGIKTSILFFYLAGAASCVFLFRKVLRLGIAASVYGSFLFLFSGYLPLHLIAGHATFISALLLPLAAGLMIQSGKKPSGRLFYAALAGWVLAIMHAEGYHITMLALPAATSGFACAFVTQRQCRKQIAFSYLIMLGVFFAAGAYRILPQIELMMTTGSEWFQDLSSQTPGQIFVMLVHGSGSPFQKRWPDQAYHWWEYGSYIGVLPLFLILPLLLLVKKKDLALLCAGIFALLMMAGRFWIFAPAAILGQLPLYNHLRAYGRWAIVFVFCLAALEAVLLNRLLKRITMVKINQGRSQRLAGSAEARFVAPILAAILCLFVSYDLFTMNSRMFSQVFNVPLPEMEKSAEFKTIRSGPQYGAVSSMMPAIRANLAVLDGYEILRSRTGIHSYDDKDYRGEYYLQGSRRQIRPVVWKPSSLEFSFESRQNDVLILNQGWQEGWQASNGYFVLRCGNLICVPVKAGTNMFQCYFRKWYIFGLLILSAGVQGALCLSLLLIAFRR